MYEIFKNIALYWMLEIKWQAKHMNFNDILFNISSVICMGLYMLCISSFQRLRAGMYTEYVAY